jgi:NADH-quinone oxidoreductase subunit G
MFENPLQAYVLWGVEPELDSAYPAAALTALQKARSVMAFSAFRTKGLENYADIILPIALFAETAGTYINVEGQWQSMSAAAPPPAGVKAGWEALCTLGKILGLQGFEYAAPEAVVAEIKIQQPGVSNQPVQFPLQLTTSQPNTLYRLGQWPIYCVDSTVRHAPALQATLDETAGYIRLHPNLAERLAFTPDKTLTARQKDSEVTLPWVADAAIPENYVWIPAGLSATAGFGEMWGEVVLCAEG